MLTPEQNECINMLIEGESKTDIHKKLGVSRTTIYNWMQNEYFKAVLNEREQQMKNFGAKLVNTKLETAIEELWDMRKSSDNAKVKADIYTYFIDRALGKPTNKTEIADNRDDNKDQPLLDEEFEQWKNDAKGEE